MRSAALGLATALALVGCAAPSAAPPLPPLVERAIQAPDPRPRLWYLGLGLYGETWSENDVAELTEELRRGATGFQLVPVVLSNLSGPFEADAIESTVADIAAAARPGDVVLIYVSTHGAPGLLGRSAEGQELAPVSTGQLQRWLAPLGDDDTVLVLSACFSGSFIPRLRGPHRIIFTAARADRTSFGCQAGAEHTVFGDAFLQALARPGESLRAVVAATRTTVAARERELRVSLPSQPQVSVGAAVEHLYAAPVF